MGLLAGALATGFVVAQRAVPAETARSVAEAQRLTEGVRTAAFR